ncbi:Uncharacterised protein [Mycobacteroides abscessus subsp. abscessus]|nr:Uncharacterised protein [Mycobacteroides abscessus subsp. abscessus]
MTCAPWSRQWFQNWIENPRVTLPAAFSVVAKSRFAYIACVVDFGVVIGFTSRFAVGNRHNQGVAFKTL